MMKEIRKIILLVLLFFPFSPLFLADAIEIETGEEAPAFTLVSVGGGAVTLGEHRGKVVVLLYFRPDQERSLLAVEDVKAMHDEYGGKGVEVLGLVADTEDMGSVQRVIQERGVGFAVLKDGGREVYGSYGIRVYPTTVIIDREGLLRGAIPGHAVTYRRRLEGEVRALLGLEAEGEAEAEPGRAERDAAGLEAERKYNLAVRFTESRLFDQAIEAARGAVEAGPGVAKAHILLGFLYLETKEAERAEGEFRRALEIEPGNRDGQTGLGAALIERGELDEAIEVLRAAAEVNPHPQMTYYELGRAYELKGEKDRAIEMYRKALDKIFHRRIFPQQEP